MGCFGGIGQNSTIDWAPAYQADWYPGSTHPSLSALLSLAAEAGKQTFTAHDLRKTCSTWVDAQLPADVRRHLLLAVNEARSGRVMSALIALTALCGWMHGGEAGARRAVISGLPMWGGANASNETMQRRHDARRLDAHEAPELLALVYAICRRAGLRRMPEVYVLAGERTMNAYALGTPDDAVITLTGGLLHGMTRAEIGAIVAHEIAHIRHGDGATMALAAGLLRSVRVAAHGGLAAVVRSGGPGPVMPLVWLLRSAPAIAELLCLALSRIRELAADACAVELIGDAQMLTSALEKLERHHQAGGSAFAEEGEHDPAAYLRSHPSTHQRVSLVRALA